MRKSFLLAVWSLLLAGCLISGCALGPDFVRPDAGLDRVGLEPRDNASLASGIVAGDVPNTWWTLFGDPVLDGLETRAAAASLDLMAASARIEQSRANLGIVTAGLVPAMQADARYARQALSEDGPMARLGAPTKAQDFWQGSIGASWELDLWGRNRRLREGAKALGLSRVYERELAHVSLTADVANTYICLRGMQSQLAIARNNVSIAKDTLRLVTTRFSNGVATAHEVAQARSEAARASALVEGRVHALDLLMNSLALLLAQPPGSLEAELGEAQPVPVLPKRVPVGLPSDLAKRRPDIRAAEERLHAATAAIGVAEASFYPSITLSGTVGLEALRSQDLNFWDSRFYSAGPSLYLPIFQGGRLWHQLELTKSEQMEAAIAYRRTVLGAWHEIDNALRLFSSEQRRYEDLKTARDESRFAFERVRRSYAEGESAYLAVLTAQRDLLSRESELQAAATSRSSSLVALYRSVGGGWNDERLIHAD